MIQFTKMFNKKTSSVIDDNLETSKIASKHSYYLKQKQMEKTTTVSNGFGKMVLGAILIVLAGYIGTQALPAPLTTLDVLQAGFENSVTVKCFKERDLAVGKLITFKDISKTVHEVLKEEMEKHGLEYKWSTPEGFIDLHFVGVSEADILQLEEKARWTCGEDKPTGDFQ
jgi:hypothetical protein